MSCTTTQAINHKSSQQPSPQPPLISILSADFGAAEGVSFAADDGEQATQQVTSHSLLSTS